MKARSIVINARKNSSIFNLYRTRSGKFLDTDSIITIDALNHLSTIFL